MLLEHLHDAASGRLSYLLGSEKTGEVMVVDPARGDVEPWMRAVAERKLTIRHVVDTCLHVDHVSGGAALAGKTSARYGLHVSAGYTGAFDRLEHGQVLSLGEVKVRVLHTPTHAPEAICLAVVDEARAATPVAVLTGSSLLVGDLATPVPGYAASADTVRESLRKLVTLGTHVLCYPGQTIGSALTRRCATARYSTIGYEAQSNWALANLDAADLDGRLTAHRTSYLPLSTAIRDVNRHGPGSPLPTVPQLSAAEALDLLAKGRLCVDLRDSSEFCAGHLAGSVNIRAGSPQFGERVRWFTRPERPLVLAAKSVADAQWAIAQCGRVGVDWIAGFVPAAELLASAGSSAPRVSNPSATELSQQLERDRALRLLDVREHYEWAEGRVRDALHIPMWEIPARVHEIPRDQAIAVMCAGGQRSSLVISLLLSQGYTRLINASGGMTAWRKTGLPTVR